MAPEKRNDSPSPEILVKSYDKISLLFSDLPERLPLGQTVFLHGAFGDLCEEYPDLFPHASPGRAGGLVRYESLTYGMQPLEMNGVVSYSFNPLVMHTNTEWLQKSTLGLEPRLAEAGLPSLEEWRAISQRFADLIEANKLKPIDELLVLR